MNDCEQKFKEIIEVLRQIEKDGSVSKTTRSKIKSALTTISQPTDLSLKIDKVRHELDEVADDPNLPAYARTQIWNIVSIIETLQ